MSLLQTNLIVTISFLVLFFFLETLRFAKTLRAEPNSHIVNNVVSCLFGSGYISQMVRDSESI